MRIEYDAEVDALSIIFRETTVTTRPIDDGITGEFDAAGNLVGLEILDVRLRLGQEETLSQVQIQGFIPGSVIAVPP